MIEGRFFSEDYSTDKEKSIVVNESLIKALKLSNPVGKTILIKDKKYTIIGVVADFHNRPLVYPIEPMILTLRENYNSILFVKMKLSSGKIGAGTIQYIKNVCRKFSPDYPLDFMFLDKIILEGTDDMQGVARVLLLFAILGIVIACLGLYGLASFAVEQRTKEIGIRKVLGSSVTGIIKLFSKEFIWLIIIANLIAAPAAYIFISNAIQSAYKPPFSIWIFIVTGLAVVMLSFLTLSYYTIKAATANPVESLRYE
ncbi:MAG: ABC transporter permease [Ignavibacteriaceae bacterium]